jgi:lipopolysaccharide/colanic/teichoic acid biosynthesis glycosyltransferase
MFTMFAFLGVAFVPGMLRAEFEEWIPSLSRWLIRQAVHQLPPAERARYEQEWLAEIESCPSKKYARLWQSVSIRLHARASAIALSPSRVSVRQNVMVEAIDRTAGLLGILFFAPFFAVLALAVRISGRGPTFVSLRQPGRYDKPIYVRQFRTVKETTTASGNYRLTRLGSFLRRTALDELPMLFNVATGSMCLIGRSLLAPKDLDDSKEVVLQLLAFRPGLMVPSKTFGPHRSRADALKFDLEFVCQSSVLSNLRFLISLFVPPVRFRRS